MPFFESLLKTNDKSTNNGGAAVVGPSLPSDAKGDPKKPNYISAEPSNATPS